MRACVERCLACETAGTEAVGESLRRGGRYAEPSFVNLILACADLCATTGRFMLLRSEFHVLMCEACADVCEACADDCEAWGADGELAGWVEACRRCAEACRELAGRQGARRPRVPPQKAFRSARSIAVSHDGGGPDGPAAFQRTVATAEITGVSSKRSEGSSSSSRRRVRSRTPRWASKPSVAKRRAFQPCFVRRSRN